MKDACPELNPGDPILVVSGPYRDMRGWILRVTQSHYVAAVPISHRRAHRVRLPHDGAVYWNEPPTPPDTSWLEEVVSRKFRTARDPHRSTTMSELQQYYNAFKTGYWACDDANECICHGSGWALSEVDTWHKCPIHFDGQLDPESAMYEDENDDFVPAVVAPEPAPAPSYPEDPCDIPF